MWVREVHRVADVLDLVAPVEDFIGHAGGGDDHVCVVFIFEALSEDVHVKRSEETKPTALSKRSGRFALDAYAAVCKSELKGQVKVSTWVDRLVRWVRLLWLLIPRVLGSRSNQPETRRRTPVKTRSSKLSFGKGRRIRSAPLLWTA